MEEKRRGKLTKKTNDTRDRADHLPFFHLRTFSKCKTTGALFFCMWVYAAMVHIQHTVLCILFVARVGWSVCFSTRPLARTQYLRARRALH